MGMSTHGRVYTVKSTDGDSREDLEEISVVRDLETVKCITWKIKLNKGNEEVSALLDSGSEANLISRAYAAQLPLKIMDTSWGLAAINKQQIRTQGMVIAGFEISDSADRTRWFEETILIADIPQPVVLGMPFLKLGNPDFGWTERTMHWRQWDAKTALMTTNRVDLIDPEDFMQQVSQESTPAFNCHVLLIERCPPEVNPFRMAQISASTTETVTLLEAHKDFKDVSPVENAGHLPPHEDHDYAIDLVDRKQPHGPIYSLLENEFSILRTYIDKNLADGFIRPAKSPSSAPILFVPKPNGGLRLCIN